MATRDTSEQCRSDPDPLPPEFTLLGTAPSWLARGLASMGRTRSVGVGGTGGDACVQQLLVCPDALTEQLAAGSRGMRVRIVADEIVGDVMAGLFLLGRRDVLPRCTNDREFGIALRGTLTLPPDVRDLPRPSDSVVCSARDCLHAARFDLNVKSLADRLGLARHDLELRVARDLRMSVHAWIANGRAQIRDYLLMSSIKGVKVASLLGYGHATALNAVVLRDTGMTPRQCGRDIFLRALQGQPLLGIERGEPSESVPSGPDSPPHPVSLAR